MRLSLDRIREFIDWLNIETDFCMWEESVKDEVHKKLIECMISDLPKERRMSEVMCEIIDVMEDVHSVTDKFYLILDCGHWYKWTSTKPPEKGSEFRCPSCNLPTVVK